jgi:hypothetical protein
MLKIVEFVEIWAVYELSPCPKTDADNGKKRTRLTGTRGPGGLDRREWVEGESDQRAAAVPVPRDPNLIYSLSIIILHPIHFNLRSLFFISSVYLYHLLYYSFGSLYPGQIFKKSYFSFLCFSFLNFKISLIFI